MELTLKQSLALAKLIKENDINNELNIYVDNINGKPKLLIEEKLITIGGLNGN